MEKAILCLPKGSFDIYSREVRSKITTLSHANLSYGARLELLRTIFQCLFYFWCSAFPSPKTTITAANGLILKFLWGKLKPMSRGASYIFKFL